MQQVATRGVVSAVSRANALAQCAAYVIARNERDTTALAKLAARFGFGVVEELMSRRAFQPADHHPPLRFFLVYRHMSEDLMIAVRKAIRASSDPGVRLAPIVLFTDECDFETYLRFIKIGFDDVLTLPDKRELLVQRLEQQINSDHTYFETAEYLGPDRRRMEGPRPSDPRRTGRESYNRLIVHRSVERGSFLTKSDLIVGSIG